MLGDDQGSIWRLDSSLQPAWVAELAPVKGMAWNGTHLIVRSESWSTSLCGLSDTWPPVDGPCSDWSVRYHAVDVATGTALALAEGPRDSTRGTIFSPPRSSMATGHDASRLAEDGQVHVLYGNGTLVHYDPASGESTVASNASWGGSARLAATQGGPMVVGTGNGTVWVRVRGAEVVDEGTTACPLEPASLVWDVGMKVLAAGLGPPCRPSDVLEVNALRSGRSMLVATSPVPLSDAVAVPRDGRSLLFVPGCSPPSTASASPAAQACWRIVELPV